MVSRADMPSTLQTYQLTHTLDSHKANTWHTGQTHLTLCILPYSAEVDFHPFRVDQLCTEGQSNRLVPSPKISGLLP